MTVFRLRTRAAGLLGSTFSLVLATAHCGSSPGAPASAAVDPDNDAGTPAVVAKTTSGTNTAPADKSDAGTGSKQLPMPPRGGVAFVHGTGDQGDTKDLVCTGKDDQYKCIVQAAIDGYWSQANIDVQRTRTDGTQRPYVVIGCPLGSHTPWFNANPVKLTPGAPAGGEAGSADCVSSQIRTFLDGPDGEANTSDDITDIAIVTHSGGSNVVRYILQQPGASADFQRVAASARRVIGLAAPTLGTYLANWILTDGSLGNDANTVIEFLGGEGQYNDDGVDFIRTQAMDANNKDPSRFATISKDQGGVPWFVGAGSYPDASLLDDASYCGGYDLALALQVLHEELLTEADPSTYRDGCSDGFITCLSSMAIVQDDPSRILFGRRADGTLVGRTHHRAHSQTLLDCDNVGLDVQAAINGASLPPDTLLASTAISVAPAAIIESIADASPSRLRAVGLGVRSPEARFERVASLEESAPQLLSRASLRVRSTDFYRVIPAGESFERSSLPLDAEARAEIRTHRVGDKIVVHVRQPETTIALIAEPPSISYDDQGAAVSLEVRDQDKLVGDVTFTVDEVGRDGAKAVLVERAAAGGRAVARLPGNLRAGTRWLRVHASGHADDGRPFERVADLPVTFVSAVARVTSIGAPFWKSGQIVVPVNIDAAEGARLGVHAEIIARDAAQNVLGRFDAQVGENVTPGQHAIELHLTPPAAWDASSTIAIPDLALVCHDNATTLSRLHDIAPVKVAPGR